MGLTHFRPAIRPLSASLFREYPLRKMSVSKGIFLLTLYQHGSLLYAVVPFLRTHRGLASLMTGCLTLPTAKGFMAHWTKRRRGFLWTKMCQTKNRFLSTWSRAEIIMTNL